MAKTTLKQVNDSPLKISINGQLARQRKTLDDLRNAITSAESWIIPQRVNLYQIYQDIVLDAHLTAVTDQRILMSLSREFKIMDVSGQEYPELTDVFNAQWFRDFCRYALDSIFWGHSLVQFGDIVNGTFTACHLLPRHLVRAEKKMWLTVPGSVNGIDYTEPPYSDWVIEVGGERDLGMLAKAAFQVLSKRFVFSSWDEFASVFGLPTKVVKINALAGDSSDKSEIASEIAKLGPSSTIVIDDTQSLEFQQVSNTDAYRVYKDLIDARNSELSKLVLGQTGTTDTQAYDGSSKVHAEVANTYSQSDMKFLKGVINDKLIPLMQRHKLLPLGIHFDYDSTERLGMTDQIAIDVAIAGMGFELDQNYLQDKYGTQIVGLKQAAEMNVSKGDGEDAPVGKSENSVSAEVENYYQYEVQGHEGCTHEVVNAGEEPETFGDDVLDDLIKQIYEGNVNSEALPKNIYKETAKRLLKATGIGLEKPDLDKPLKADSKFVQKLQNNIHFFSAAKTYTQVVELGNLITKEDGSRRTFSEFQAAAMPIAKNYNQNYLRAEYDATVAGSRMGAQWQEMQDNADVFPNIKYRTIGDSQVRPAHKELDGVTRPMKDNFWDSNYPPNGWGCRCTVIQMGADVKITATHALPVLNDAQQPPVFRNNVGKTGEVFSKEHPYFKEKGAKEAAEEMAKDDIKVEAPFAKAEAPHEGDKRIIAETPIKKKLKDIKLTAKDLQELGSRFGSFDEGLRLAKAKRANGELGKLSKLNDAEIAAIHSYTASSSKINEALQDGVDNIYTAKIIKLINQGVNKGSETFQTVYRGTALSDNHLNEIIDSYNNKTPYEHKRFVSTSIDTEVADRFLATSSKRPNKVKYIINNAKGAFIEAITDFATEKEVLLKSGTKFVVNSFIVENGLNIIKLTQI